jgi:hypothetical protein
MTQGSLEQGIYKSAFLDLFPEECQDNCIVAKAAAAKAGRQVLELGITFETATEILAHRFGRCVVGPTIEGMCGKKSLCNNELVQDFESPIEAAEILAVL